MVASTLVRIRGLCSSRPPHQSTFPKHSHRRPSKVRTSSARSSVPNPSIKLQPASRSSLRSLVGTLTMPVAQQTRAVRVVTRSHLSLLAWLINIKVMECLGRPTFTASRKPSDSPSCQMCTKALMPPRLKWVTLVPATIRTV